MIVRSAARAMAARCTAAARGAATRTLMTTSAAAPRAATSTTVARRGVQGQCAMVLGRAFERKVLVMRLISTHAFFMEHADCLMNLTSVLRGRKERVWRRRTPNGSYTRTLCVVILGRTSVHCASISYVSLRAHWAYVFSSTQKPLLSDVISKSMSLFLR